MNVNRSQATYEQLNLRVREVDISRSIEQDTMNVLEPASPSLRTRKKEFGVFGAAAFGGLVFGVGILALVAFRDDRFDSHAELNDNLGGGIVGQVPEVKKLPRGKKMPLLEANDTRYMFAEAYRSLRSALLFLRTDGHRPKAILVTSALPGEGKSTVASNLARAMAFGGARVVLVDADLRKGALHEAFGVRKDPGLAEVLLHPELLAEAIQPAADLPGLFILPRGRARGNPGDLLLGGAFDRVLAQLREQYDHVVFDSSPIFAADDASTIAPKLDGTVFVVRRGFSRAGIVREAMETLYQRQAPILGVVFNRANTESGSYHYYKYAEYYHTDPKEAAQA
jgi:capsular exopolysaccharide synthesis family protein